MKNILLTCLLVCIAFACKKEDKPEKSMIKIAEWLIGNWENEMEQGTLLESWEKVNDSTFSGTSYFLKSKDTLNNETILLTQKGNDLFYTPTVLGQNNNRPVVFKMAAGTSKQLVFKNPQHDFPQTITYTQITKDSLVAEISGIENGKEVKESYPMKRR